MFSILSCTTYKLYSQSTEFLVPDGDCYGYCTTISGNCPTLVCNSNFQYISAAPFLDLGGILDLDFSCGWQNVRILQQGTTNNFWPHAGTPDVFSLAYPSGQGSGIPLNARGIQNDHTSNNNSTGYIGIYTYRNVAPKPNWREYATLHQPIQMQAGQTYQISFWVSLGEISTKATSIQVYLGQNVPTLPVNQVSNYHDALTMLTPVYTSPTITNSTGWTQLTFNFTPNTSGNYYLIIGNFRNNANTPLTNVTTANVQGVVKENAAYYYIDDVVIKSTLPDECCNFDHVLGDPLWGNSTNLSTINILPGQRVLLLGDISIDQTISLLNNDIVMGPDAELNFEPGVSLSAINTRFRGCEYMWYGINANFANNSISLTRCTFQDAINGIKMSGGGLLSLNNNNFINNNISLQLSGFSGVWPLMQFRSNTFRQIGSFKGIYPDAAPAYSQPYQHIKISNVGWVSLVAPQGINNRNRFLHAQTGIFAEKSGLTVSNAAFQLIRNLNGSLTNSWAIDAENGGVGNYSSLYGLKVNNQWGPVQFQQCDNGIRVQGSYYSEIHNNNFWQIKGTAFYQLNTSAWPWWNNTTAQIDVKQNQISNVQIGVDLYNINYTYTQVTGNIITNTPYRDKSFAIRAQNLMLPKDCRGKGLIIVNNQTNRFKTGISVDNFGCPRIDTNVVNLNNPNWDQAHGIWVRGCYQPYIQFNNVNGSGKAWYSQGIRLEFSPISLLACNYVNNTENALWIHNNNNFSTIKGNTLANYKYGLHLTYNGLIGSQFISGTQKYDLFNSFDLNPMGTDVDLYTSLSTNGNNSPVCLRSAIFSGVVSINDPNSDPISKEPANNLSEQNYCGIATKPFSGSYPMVGGNYANENRWITKFKYAQVFKGAADSITQLFDSPYFVDQVIDSISVTAIEDMWELDSLIEEKYWNEAWSKVMSTNATHPMEELKLNASQRMLKYLPVLWNGQDTTVYSGDVAWLYEVANRCPYQWGEVVFQARMFIHRYVNADTLFADNCLPYNPNIPRLEQFNDTWNPLVYPNPAVDELYVISGNDEALDYMIQDVQGRMIQNNMLQSGTAINISDLPAGYYFITLNNGTSSKTIAFVKN